MSLPLLNAQVYASGDNTLARALASAMHLPEPEDEKQGIYRAAITAILGALAHGEMEEDAAAALWAPVHTHLPYRIERPDEVGVEWSEEDAAMVQQLDQQWLADIEARGEARGVLRAKRAWLKEDVTTRFGALSPEVAARIDAIESEDRLDAVKRRLATATSPDQLFA